MTDQVALPLAEGEYEGPRRRHVTTLTVALTAGELRGLIGSTISLLTRARVRRRGVLVDVDARTIALDGDPDRIPIADLAHVRRVRRRQTLSDEIAELRARVAALERDR